MGFHFSILASDPAVMSGTEAMLAFLKPTIFCWQHPCTATSFGTDLPPMHYCPAAPMGLAVVQNLGLEHSCWVQLGSAILGHVCRVVCCYL